MECGAVSTPAFEKTGAQSQGRVFYIPEAPSRSRAAGRIGISRHFGENKYFKSKK